MRYILLFIACMLLEGLQAQSKYQEEQVSIPVEDFQLAGTLSMPKNAKKVPAVILITGSGPQNRDSDILGFKMFAQIAEALNAQGIAVLRCDDRGVGASTGSLAEATTAHLVQDTWALFRYLQTRPEIDPKRIGLYGHSEGAAIASILAAYHPEIAWIVLAGGSGVSGADLLLEQNRLIGKASGLSEEQLTQARAFNQKAYETVLSSKRDWEALEKAFQALLPPGVPEAQAKAIFQQQKAALESPWIEYFLGLNPAEQLARVKCPALLLFGELDLQVPPAQNEAPMKAALQKAGNKNVESRVFTGANHLFQNAKTGLPNEYATLEKQFTEGFLDYLGAWVRKQSFKK